MSDTYSYNYKGYPHGSNYPWDYAMPSKEEGVRRWDAIRRSMKQHNLDCLIVPAPFGYMGLTSSHLPYISNFVPYMNRGTYVVFPIEGEPQLGVNNVLGPQFVHCATETSWMKEIVGSLKPVQDVVNKVRQLGLENGTLGLVGYRAGIFPASANDILRQAFPGATFEEATAALEEAMDEVSRTSQEELSLLRKACEIHDLSFDAVAQAMKPGVMECELWAVAEKVIVENGGWYPHFMIATSGPSPSFLRAPASRNRLSKGDVILFETNLIYGGVAPQISYALSLGRPSDDMSAMFKFCEDLYEYALTQFADKRTFGDVESDLLQRIQLAGYEPMTPQSHRYNMTGVMPAASKPRPGDYFTVHPNIGNKDYTASAKVGDAVRIADDGKVERLQRTPAKLHVVEV